MSVYKILIVGVGGQGILTMSKVIGSTANTLGLSCLGAETHGMAQRGGSVSVHMKIGTNPQAPLIADGQADLLIALEPVEALRNACFINKKGIILTSSNPIEPPNLVLLKKEYPSVSILLQALKKYSKHVITIDFKSLLKDIGMKAINMAVLGAVSSLEGFPLPQNDLLIEMKNKYPKFFEMNKKAFKIGSHQNLSPITTTVD
ncbi:MAG: indolepyruvate oxidoreductase subunit beta [Candidatus Hodarchaeales archaeon]